MNDNKQTSGLVIPFKELSPEALRGVIEAVNVPVRRKSVDIMRERGLSENKACMFMKIRRSSYRYQAHPRDDTVLYGCEPFRVSIRDMITGRFICSLSDPGWSSITRRKSDCGRNKDFACQGSCSHFHGQ